VSWENLRKDSANDLHRARPSEGGILEKISNPLAPPQLGAYFGAVLLLRHYTIHINHFLDFSFVIFSSISCLKKPVFSLWDLLWWKAPARRLYWDLLTSKWYQSACHYF